MNIVSISSRSNKRRASLRSEGGGDMQLTLPSEKSFLLPSYLAVIRGFSDCLSFAASQWSVPHIAAGPVAYATTHTNCLTHPPAGVVLLSSAAEISSILHGRRRLQASCRPTDTRAALVRPSASFDELTVPVKVTYQPRHIRNNIISETNDTNSSRKSPTLRLANSTQPQ